MDLQLHYRPTDQPYQFLRLMDLACSLSDHATTLYLVVPDSRRKEVEIQLTRPSIRQTNTPIRYILMSELGTHCDALCKFGDSHRVLEKICQTCFFTALHQRIACGQLRPTSNSVEGQH